MGCGHTKENIEAEMLLLQLMRTEFQDERKAILKQLKEINGKKVYTKYSSTVSAVVK